MVIQDLQQLMNEALDSPGAHQAAAEHLGLDELNWCYFFQLYRSRVRGRSNQRPMRIYEPGGSPAGVNIVYPVSLAPAELKSQMKRVDYGHLKTQSEGRKSLGPSVALWVKKMQAGSGSSMTRTSYLSRQWNRPEGEIQIGAKGTDLFVHVPERISLAEAQIVQCLRDFERHEIGEIFFHDIVSSETDESVSRIWKKKSLDQPSLTYEALLQKNPALHRFGRTFQSFVPTLDHQNHLSFGRVAPAGHALFAIDALRAAYRSDLRPQTSRPLVAAISNGEDLSGAPDSRMLDYLVREQVPIALVTTERTSVDLKGGLISILQEEDGTVSLTVLETAQAKEAGQEELFSRLPGAMNTNLALFNYEVLVPLITREVQEIGEDRFLEVISPDLIVNSKSQKEADGSIRSYLQLEGAMGSTLMNLDRYWRRKHGQPLVHLIEVDRHHRTEFFSPIKTAFDFWMQFHSDRFALDRERMRLRNFRPGSLPSVILRDAQTGDRYYQDIQNVLNSFEGTSIRDLDELVVEGQADLRGLTLKGTVRISIDPANGAGGGLPELRKILGGGGPILENISIKLDADGKLERSPS